jgi:thiosulfate/3-mercaptopyruvate sulfurtransferase
VAYRRAHIPGAVFSEAHPYKSAENHRLVMGPEAFAAAMSALGIGPGTTVVAYDSNGAVSAGRLWWCLRYYGHAEVRVLDGGWPRWLAEGRPITMAESSFESLRMSGKGTFVPQVDESQLATADDVLAAAGNPDVVILDVRSDREWEGIDARGNPRAGHIPGAVHLENKLSMAADEAAAFKDPAALRQLFESCGITPEKEVITL